MTAGTPAAQGSSQVMVTAVAPLNNLPNVSGCKDRTKPYPPV